MTREEVFIQIYERISTLLEENKSEFYNATILSYVPSYQFDEYPLIVLSQFDYRLQHETLAKTEKKHFFVIEAQIFSIDTTLTNKRVIGNKVAELVESVIENEYGLKLDMSNVIPNLNENIHRIMLRFSGLIDDDTLTIYRTI